MAGPDDPAAGTTPPVVQNFEPARRHVGSGPDTDGDGLSDDFEQNVFGSDPSAPDKDNDGLNDWAEYWIDTNPHDDDTDDDGFLDGEDLAFGDPLAVNAGGAARTALREQARKLFDAEGSDQDKDWVRDHVETAEGTKKDNPDSDGDGLGDAVEIQLRTHGVTTSQDSTPDDTTDLDAARAKLGERRWEAEHLRQQQGSSSSSSLDEPVDGIDGSLIAGEPYDASFEQPTFEQPSFAEPASEEPAFSESSYDDTMIADAGDTPSDGSSDSWA